jgi:DNA-binding NtrC family response regulator
MCLSDPGLTLSANSAEQGMKHVESRDTPILILEMDAPGNLEALAARALQLDPDTQLIVLGDATEAKALEAWRGIENLELLPRPADPQMLRSASDRAAEVYTLRRLLKLRRCCGEAPGSWDLLGSSPVTRAFSDRLSKLAAHDASVLITGEAGTGKGRVARLIHAQSRRSESLMVAMNCLVVPPEEHEARLFGKAASPDPGLLEMAEGGTLHLAEVDSLSLPAQERLQKAVKEREFSPVDGRRQRRLDLRIISSTRMNLRSAVHKKLFVEELYWSLCGVALEVPPLRERSGDIEELLLLFMEEACRQLGKKAPSVPPALVNAVRAHNFPGNVGELKHLAGLLASLSEGSAVTLAALPAQMMTPLVLPRSAPAGALALKPIVHEFEKQFLVRALKAVGGNQSKAARVLDIHRNTLILKMQDLGIPNKRAKTKPRSKSKVESVVE